MAARKNTLVKYQNITNGDMSGSITSTITNIEYLDNIGIQLNFSGAPVGSFAIQVSADHAEDTFGQQVTTPGNWIPLTLTYFNGSTFTSAQSVPTSVGSPIYLDLNQLSATYIRVVYTAVSGTGTLNGFITAKMI